MEKLWTITCFELMLLIRKRRALVFSLLAALAGGALFSLAGRPEYGLFLVLPVASFLMARETGLRAQVGRTMRTGLPSVALSHIVSTLALIPFLIILFVLYALVALALHSEYSINLALPGLSLLLAFITGFTAKLSRT